MDKIDLGLKLHELEEEYEFTKLYDTYDEDRSTLKLIQKDIEYYNNLLLNL